MSQGTREPAGWVPPTEVSTTPAAIEADWVVYGKTARSSADYGVLRSSSAYFSRVDYGTILRRFSPGTPPAPAPGPSTDGLPWATVSYAPMRSPAGPQHGTTGLQRGPTGLQRSPAGSQRTAADLRHGAAAVPRRRPTGPGAPGGPDGPGVLGIAVYGWTDLVDVVGRPVIGTTYLCAPFESFATVPVSYLDLFNALTQDVGVAAVVGPDAIRVARGTAATGAGRPPAAGSAGSSPAAGATTRPAGGPVRLRRLPGLDPGEVAQFLAGDQGATFQLVAGVAALLLCQPVALVGARPTGPESRVPERLRFFDAVAALLPYGQRARLVASTWADAGLAHHIRLAYTARPRHGDATVRMPTRDRPAGLPSTPPPEARDYYQVLIDLRKDRGVPVEDIVAHLQQPVYRRARAIDDHRNALLSLTDLGGPKIFAARLVPARAQDLDRRAQAETIPAEREKLRRQAETVEIAHAAALLRAQRRRGRLLAGAASAGLDVAARDALATRGERGAAVVQELVLRAIDEDWAAVASGRAAAPGGPGLGETPPAAAGTQGWLDWAAGARTRTLVRPVEAFVEAASGRPGPEAFARLARGEADARRKALALLRLARLTDCSRLLNEKVWQVVLRSYGTDPVLAGPRGWSDQEKAAWAKEIGELPVGAAEGADDARFDVARILLGAESVSPLRDRMSALYFRSYCDNVVQAVNELVAHHAADPLPALERVMDGFAASLDQDSWPDGPAAANALRLLWRCTQAVSGGHVSPRLRATVAARLGPAQTSAVPLDGVEFQWRQLLARHWGSGTGRGMG